VHPAAQADHDYVWHPFTQMRDWLRREPIVIAHGRGAVLTDVHGNEYLDANSSIWTNLHGHRHPKINRAIKQQLGKVAHSSALGLANEPASFLAERLVKAADGKLRKVFFSDDGSTAVEVALKLSYQFSRRKGVANPRFLSLEGAYHGDTVGAVSVGHIDLFHSAFRGLLFESGAVMAPYCYRCPFNRAKPERADARTYRKCQWECVDLVAKAFRQERANAFVFEPSIQGAAGMIPQPPGWLERVGELAREHSVHLIADEVLTGFGRASQGEFLATQTEKITPDFVVLAKGMTGGYLPMAATLTTLEVFEAFLGEYAEFKTFFHGHSFTGNQLGSAAALASLDLLQSDASLKSRQRLARDLQKELNELWSHPNVGDVRQVGLISGIELVRNWQTREPFALAERVGIRVCEAMAAHGVLTRPIGNVIVIMPPYCTTSRQLRKMVEALRLSIDLVLGGGAKSDSFP
jgi:adenosylmethionine---8-amino-7-oxononanoate aminotransferase